MTDIRKLNNSDINVLNVCCQIEETCANLYRYFSKLYAEDTDFRALWEKTAKEEDNHAEQFRFACRLQNSGMHSLKVDIKKASAILAKMQSVYEGVQTFPPPPKEALRLSISLENSLADYHLNTIVDFDDPGLAKLFTSMMNNDKEHIQLLEKTLKKLSS